jgi:hypothetical protein
MRQLTALIAFLALAVACLGQPQALTHTHNALNDVKSVPCDVPRFHAIYYIEGFSGKDGVHFTNPHTPIDWTRATSAVTFLMREIPTGGTVMINTGVWESYSYDPPPSLTPTQKEAWRKRIRDIILQLVQKVRSIRPDLKVTYWGVTPDMCKALDLYLIECYGFDPNRRVASAVEIALKLRDIDNRTTAPVYGSVWTHYNVASHRGQWLSDQDYADVVTAVRTAGARLHVWENTSTAEEIRTLAAKVGCPLPPPPVAAPQPVYWVGFAGNPDHANALDPIWTNPGAAAKLVAFLDQMKAKVQPTPVRKLRVALWMPQGMIGFDPEKQNWPAEYDPYVWTGMPHWLRLELQDVLKPWLAANADTVEFYVYGGRCRFEQHLIEYTAWLDFVGIDGFWFDMCGPKEMADHVKWINAAVPDRSKVKLIGGEALALINTTGDPSLGTFRHGGLDPAMGTIDPRCEWLDFGQFHHNFARFGPCNLPAGVVAHYWIEQRQYAELEYERELAPLGFIVGAGGFLLLDDTLALERRDTGDVLTKKPVLPPPPPTPSADLHVSAAGSDSNPGTQELPLLTVTKAYELATVAGTTVRLRCGDTFRERIALLKSGINIGTWGTGSRPILLGTYPKPCIESWGADPLDNVTVTGLDFRSIGYPGDKDVNNVGYPAVSIIRPGKNLNFVDCRVSAIGTGFSDGFIIQGFPGVRQGGSVVNCVIDQPFTRNNQNGGTGIFLAQYDGIRIEGCVIRGPVNPDGTYDRTRHMSHAIYAGENNPATSIFRNNIAMYGGRTNFNIRAGGTVENNLSYWGAQGITMGIGYADSVAAGSIKDNVIIHNRDEQAGVPIGFGVSITKANGIAIENNLFLHGTDGKQPIAFNLGNVANVVIQNNIVYDWGMTSPPTWPMDMIKVNAPSSGIALRGNHITHFRGILNTLNTADTTMTLEGNVCAGTGTYASKTGFASGALSYPDPQRRVDAAALERAIVRPLGVTDAPTASSVNAWIRAGFGR